MKTDPRIRAKTYACRLLNYRPRSEKEIRDKLVEKGFAPAIIDDVAIYLKEKNLVNDEGFAKLWMKSRLQSSGQGFLKIRNELLQKGVSRDIIENVTAQLECSFNEYDIASQLVERRLPALKHIEEYKARQRLYSYLKRRGFSGKTIYRIIDEAF
jgi:regulatory protein